MDAPLSVSALLEEWLVWCAWIADPANRDRTNDPIGHSEFVWTAEEYPERAWEAILKVVAEPRAQAYLGHLAAGPMEDLLNHHGAEFIERVETTARDNPTFARMLAGVNKFMMPDEVWQRVQKAKSEGGG
jgi:hypothetical protein